MLVPVFWDGPKSEREIFESQKQNLKVEILKKVRELKSLTDVLDIDTDDDDNDDDNDDDDDDGDGDDDGVSKRCSHQKIPLQRRMHFGGKYQVHRLSKTSRGK